MSGGVLNPHPAEPIAPERGASLRAALLAGVFLLAVMPVIGLALVTLADLVPDRPILDELVSAVEDDRINRQFVPRSTSGRFMDTWTDCIGITIGLGDDPEASRWTASIRSPNLGNCQAAVPRIRSWADGEGLPAGREYFRYWHGYASVVRPMIATVGLIGTRIVTGWLMVAAVAGLGWSLARRHGIWAAVALLVPIVLTTDLLDLPASLPHAWGSLAAIATAGWVHWFLSRRWSYRRVVVSSMVAGATFLFLDILTIPPGAWALCVFAAVAASSRLVRGADLVATAALSTLSWIVAWTWMWVSKWILAVPVFGYDRVREDIGDQASLRLSGEEAFIDLAFGETARTRVSLWLEHPMSAVVLAAVVVIVVVVIVSRRRDGSLCWDWPNRILLLAPAAIPPVWFEILRNHSQVHGFTSRSVAYSLGIVAAALLVRLGSAQSAAPAAPEEDASEIRSVTASSA